MERGDTLFGLDRRGHLWIVLTTADANGTVAVANFTTHDIGGRAHCSESCTVVKPGEHPYPSHDTCLFYLHSRAIDVESLDAGVAEGSYAPHDPVSTELLERIRMGALSSDAPEAVKAAIRRDLQ